MSDNIKESSEIARVQIFQACSIWKISVFFGILMPLCHFQAKYKQIIAEAQASTTRGTMHILHFKSLCSLFDLHHSLASRVKIAEYGHS